MRQRLLEDEMKLIRRLRKETRIQLIAVTIACGCTLAASAVTYPDYTAEAPSPLPQLPEEWNSFNPPVNTVQPASDAPGISEWTRTTGPGETMALTSSLVPDNFIIFGRGYTNSVQSAGWYGSHGALTLPNNLPSGEVYLLWAQTNGKTGRPIAVNKAESWWLTDVVGAGDIVTLFGRNFGSDCKVWVAETGEWLSSVSSNPYKAEFEVPAGYSNGTYTLWAHNGSGGKYGFSHPLTLTVRTMPQWNENPDSWFNVKDYGAKGDGVSEDWFGAIEEAISAADKVEWSTVYFPAGDYRIGSKLRLTGSDKIRIVGAGRDQVTIQPYSSYASSSWPKYIIQNTLHDFELKGVTLKANSYGGEQIIRMENGSSGIVFDGIRLDQFDASVTYAALHQSSDKIIYMSGVHGVKLLNSEFVQRVNILATLESEQIFVSNCTFIGCYDANTLFGIKDSKAISITDSVARNYDDSASENESSAWCQGRWIHGNGGIRDFYFSGNATSNMTVRAGFTENQNTGEQVMFEFARTHFRSAITAGSSATVTTATVPASDLVGQVLIVQNGCGQGQNRIITSISGNVITIDAPWNVIPDTTSIVLIGEYSKRLALYQNRFDGRPRALGTSFVGCAGVEPYGGCVDLVVDDNQFTELRFPINIQSKDTVGDQGQISQPNFFNLIANNSGSNCYNAVAMYVDKTAGVTYHTPQLLGNVYRKNVFDGLASAPYLYHGDFTSSVDGELIHMQVFDQNVELNYTGDKIEYKNIESDGVENQIFISPSATPPPPAGPPAPILSEITISGPVFVDEETAAQYYCSATYSDGTTASVDPVWSDDSGSASIDASGILAVADVTADETLVVSASFDGKLDSLTVTLNYVPPVLDRIEISGPAVLDEGTTAQFTCIAFYSDGTSLGVTPTWSEDNAASGINAAGLLTAGDVLADQDVLVSAGFDGKTDTHAISIHYIPPTLSGLTILGPLSMDEETISSYSCIGSFSDGTTAIVAPQWSENSSVASIAQDGVLSSANVSSDETAVLTASLGGYTASYTVMINYVAPIFSGISILGSESVSEESSAQYSCVALYSDGTSQSISPSWTVDSSIASFNSSGLLSAGNVTEDQAVTITASFDGKSDSQVVNITYTQPTLSGLTVSGPLAVDEGTSAHYICTANYSDGTSQTISADWATDSGLAGIDGAGWLLAGDVIENVNVAVMASFGGFSDTLSVTLNYVLPPVVLTGLSISGSPVMEENTAASFSCTATYSDGSSETVDPSWSVDLSSMSIDSSGQLQTGNIEEDQVATISATFGGQTSSHSLTIWAVGTRIIYPLTGFSGKTVKARLWDETAQQWQELGEMVSPDELVVEHVEDGRWYWVSISEFNSALNDWEQVHSNWISM